MYDVHVPAEWRELDVDGLTGTVMIIGRSDSGKSTLARYLFVELCRRGRRAAYLDCDVGQSSLGLPTTMNVALAAPGGEPCFPPTGPAASFFVGSATPRGHMLPTVVGAHKLQQRAREWEAEVIVVDTTGLVDAWQGGGALKQWKIALLEPETVIGLQRQRELEHILGPLRRDRRVRAIELPVSARVVARRREERTAYRRERLRRYFAPARRLKVPLRQIAAFNIENLAPYRLLAFEDGDGFVMALGVAVAHERATRTVTVLTPLADTGAVNAVRFGTWEYR